MEVQNIEIEDKKAEIVKTEAMEKIYSEILQKMSTHKELPILIAIDGRCAAGKTTLAAWLKERFDFSVNVIHMDHFFLQPHQRTKERLQEPGQNVDYERFLEEVMLPLSQGKSFSYQIYDCKKMELSSKIQVEPAALTIVEGSYSCHPVLWDFYHLRIFLNIDSEEQLGRICRRNGAEAVSTFQEKWIPLEEKYFTAYQIQKRCDLALIVK